MFSVLDRKTVSGMESMESSRMRDGEESAGRMRTHVTYLDMVTEDYLHTIGNIFLTRSVSIASAK